MFLNESGSVFVKFKGNSAEIIQIFNKYNLKPVLDEKMGAIEIQINMTTKSLNVEELTLEQKKDRVLKGVEAMMANVIPNYGEVPFTKKKTNLGYIIPYNPEFQVQTVERITKRFNEQLEKAKAKFPGGFSAAFDFQALPED